MGKLLIDEHPLILLPSLAKEIGLNEAVFLQQLNYWLLPTPTHKPYYFEWEGEILPWVYNTYEEKTTRDGRKTGWVTNFPFWSVRTIKRVVSNLRNMDLIIVTDKFNELPTNRTLWYTINRRTMQQIESKLNHNGLDDSGGTLDSDKLARSDSDKVAPSDSDNLARSEDDKLSRSDSDSLASSDRAKMTSSRGGQPVTLMTETTSEITHLKNEKKVNFEKIVAHLMNYNINRTAAQEMAVVFTQANLSLEAVEAKMRDHLGALRPEDTIGLVVYRVREGMLDPPPSEDTDPVPDDNVDEYSERQEIAQIIRIDLGGDSQAVGRSRLLYYRHRDRLTLQEIAELAMKGDDVL